MYTCFQVHMDITFRWDRYKAGHPLILMQGSIPFGWMFLWVLQHLATIPQSPCAIARVFWYLAFLRALSHKPQKARLNEYKHIDEKGRKSEKRTLEWVSITYAYDSESRALRLRQSGSRSWELRLKYIYRFIIVLKNTPSLLAKIYLFSQVSKLTGGAWETLKTTLP